MDLVFVWHVGVGYDDIFQVLYVTPWQFIHGARDQGIELFVGRWVHANSVPLVQGGDFSGSSQDYPTILKPIMNETTKRNLLIGLIFLSSAPALLLVPIPDHVTLKTFSLYASQVFGYFGLLLLLWSYIIGARSVFALWFRDLAPVLKIHKLLGKYGSLAVLLHPLLVTYYYGESLLYSAIPHIGSEFERHVTLGRVAFALMVIIWLTSVLVRKKLGHRPWKYVHYLAYISLPFALLHIPGVGTGFAASMALQVYYFVIVVATFIFTLLRLRGLIDSDKSEYTISRHGKIAEATYSLELTPQGSSWLKPRPGQYVYLKIGALSEDHPFSVLTFDETTGKLTLGYRVFGRFTKYLQDQKVGAGVRLSGPYGEFLQQISPDSPFVCIAGGIGVTPFVAPLMKSGGNGWLFYANRTRAGATLSDQLKNQLGNKYVGIFSRENELEPNEEQGYVSAELLKKRLQTPDAYQYFICGPEPMVEASKLALKELGISPKKIHTEAFEF